MNQAANPHASPSATPSAPELAARLEALLRAIAIDVRPCRRCGTLIAFVRHRDSPHGPFHPYTLDGVNHFRNCPFASEFSRRRATPTPEPPQASLFEAAPLPD